MPTEATGSVAVVRGRGGLLRTIKENASTLERMRGIVIMSPAKNDLKINAQRKKTVAIAIINVQI